MAQVFVLQLEVTHDTRREVLGEDIADANQFAQGCDAVVVIEFEGEAVLVSVLLVEICGAVPMASLAPVLVHRAGAVVIKASARLNADYLRAHVAEQFDGVRDGDELSHFDYANACEWQRHTTQLLMRSAC